MIRPREHLLGIQRSMERMGERSGYVCLDRNERVEPVPQEVEKDLQDLFSAALFCSYPDPTPLYTRLEREIRYPEDWIYVTPGSDAAIRMLFQAYVEPGYRVVYLDPSYAMYAIYTQIVQGLADVISYLPDRQLDVACLFQALQRRPRLVVLANPDQPTGSVLLLRVIRQIVERAVETKTLVILDEAYYPFHKETGIGLVREYPNLVVTRSFSKAQGLAGLRLGYLVASPTIVSAVQRIRGAHEVNAAAIATGVYMLDHPDIMRSYLEEVEAGRRVLTESAQRLGLGCPPCPTNFQLLCFPEHTDMDEVVRGLKNKRYLVKGGFSAPSVRHCIRVTLGSPKTMLAFAEALGAVMAEQELLP